MSWIVVICMQKWLCRACREVNQWSNHSAIGRVVQLVCACVYLSHVTRCVQSAAVKRNKMQVLVLVCSTEYPLCVLVLVSQSVFLRV